MWQRQVPLSFLSACRLDRLFSVMENSCVPIRVIIRTSAVPTCGLKPLGFSKNNILDDDYFSVPVDFRHCASYGFAFVDFPNTDPSNSEHVFPSVCQRWGSRTMLCDHELFCVDRCCPCAVQPYCSLAECQWQFQHQQRVSDSPGSSISTFDIKNCRQEQTRVVVEHGALPIFCSVVSARRPAQH